MQLNTRERVLCFSLLLHEETDKSDWGKLFTKGPAELPGDGISFLKAIGIYSC